MKSTTLIVVCIAAAAVALLLRHRGREIRFVYALFAPIWGQRLFLTTLLRISLPPLGDLPRDLANDIASMAFLNDAALFQVARSTLSPDLHAQITELLEQKGRGELSASEQARLDDLVYSSEALVLRRAQAAVLLQRRGYDMSDPSVLYRLP